LEHSIRKEIAAIQVRRYKRNKIREDALGELPCRYDKRISKVKLWIMEDQITRLGIQRFFV
jgi:hypothetical protein